MPYRTLTAEPRPFTESPTGASRPIAIGDFDADGLDDLAYRATIGGALRIAVYLGSALGADAEPTWLGDPADDPAAAHTSTAYGHALVAADFDDDGFEDLAVADPGYAVGVRHPGAVAIYFGSSEGVARTAHVLRGDTVVAGSSRWQGFGSDLASGDLASGDAMDLVVGVAPENRVVVLTNKLLSRRVLVGSASAPSADRRPSRSRRPRRPNAMASAARSRSPTTTATATTTSRQATARGARSRSSGAPAPRSGLRRR